MENATIEVLKFIPDAGATVVFIVFMYLWHKRTMRRDEIFYESLKMFREALQDCMRNDSTKTPPI